MPYHLLVGVDWSTTSHQVCVLDPTGKVLHEAAVEHRAASITSFVDELVAEAGGDPETIAIAIERPRGSLVEALLDRGLHVYSLNPKQLDRFRDRHTVAGAKDDRLDAFVLGDALRNDRHCFRRVETDHPIVIQIRELSRVNEDMRDEVNRLTNRLRDQIHRFAPHLLQLSPSADEPWFWELVERVLAGRTPSQARTVQALLKQYRIRRLSGKDVLDVLKEPAMKLAPGSLEAARLHISLLLPRLRVVLEQRKRCLKTLDSLINQLADEHDDDGPSDLEILRSVPGVGSIVIGTLLAEAAPLLAQRDATGLRAYGGPAPITRRSGKSCVVVMRRGCNDRLRDAFYHWSRVSTTCDPASKNYYVTLRGRGHSHGRALRSVSDRWLRILMSMLRHRTLYSPTWPMTNSTPSPA